MESTLINNEKLKKFTAAVDHQIEERIEVMLLDAENEKNRILEHAEAEAKIVSVKHFDEAIQKRGNKYVRDISKAELNMKKELLRRREKLTDSVFETVLAKIAEYRKTPEYADRLAESLLDVHLSDGSVVFLSEDDLKFADDLKANITGKNITFTKDAAIHLGGLSVYNKERGTITDKTFDLLLEEQKTAFANSNAFQ